MKLGDALRFPFRGPHAWPNIALLFVCILIPIVGPIVAIGFQCGVEKVLAFNPDADAPRFDFGMFGRYLQRGVIPFVVGLLAALVLLPIVLILVGGTVIGVILAAQDHPWAAAGIIFIAVILWIVLTFAFNLVMTPIGFRAGVEGVIFPAFQKEFVIEFIRRVGWQMLLFQVQIFLLTLPVFLIVCIPLLPYAILGVFLLINAHARVQLYHTYLERGGTPLAIVPEEAGAGFPVMVDQPVPML